jgi:ABC-2 type transport system ATP-binding protein
MVEVDGLVKRYGDKVAVDGLSLSVEGGEIFAFLGPNGAGKTTTIKVMAGLLRPTSGTVTIGGHDIVKEPEAAKSRMAYVPDEPYLYDKLTGREFLHFVAELYGMERAAADERIAELSKLFDFAHYMDELCEGYSHGMRQRVVVGSALVHDPDVLLIDEPFVGLDPRSARHLKDSFRQLTERGATVFLSTHTLGIAQEMADRICIINHGKTIALGTPEEIGAGERDLEEIFLELTEEPTEPQESKEPD